MPKVWWCQMSNLEAPLIFNMRIQNVPFYVDSIWCWWLPKFMVNHSYYATVSPQLTESEGSNVASRWSSRCGKMFCYLAVFGQFSNPLLQRDGSWSWLNNNNMRSWRGLPLGIASTCCSIPPQCSSKTPNLPSPPIHLGARGCLDPQCLAVHCQYTAFSPREVHCLGRRVKYANWGGPRANLGAN